MRNWPRVLEEWAKKERRQERGATHSRKLVIAPAPAPANASWGKESGMESACAFVHRITFCNSLYDKNSDAFSAIAPTIGAGRPYSPEHHFLSKTAKSNVAL